MRPGKLTNPGRPVLVGGAQLLVGAVALSAGWSGPVAALILVSTALLPYASMLATSNRRGSAALPPAWLLLVLIAGFVAGERAGIGGLTALRDGVPSLLTAPRPAPATPELLLPGVLLTVLIGVWVGARCGHVAALLGAIVLYLAGALLTAGQADPYGLLAAALVLTAMLGWAMADRGSNRGGGRVAISLAGTALSIIAAGAVTLAVLPTADAFEPRRLVTPPPLPLVERNPLPRLAALANQDDVLFHHTAGNWRLHLVALTVFDGNSWQADAVYRPLGAVGPGSLPPGTSRTSVTADIAIEALDGPWLPAVGVPEEVDRPGIAVDTASGSIVVSGGARPGLRYRVRGEVDTPSDEALLVASVPAVEAYLSLPRLPFAIAEYAQEIVQGAGTPFEQAVLIERAVREGRRVDANAPAGSSYARLETFLFGQDRQPGARAGTSEQFATAFAVLARSVNLPTRVVFGFGPGRVEPDGSWLVRGRDALAWPEVYFTGLGWVPFDPSPDAPDMVGPSDATRRVVLDRVEANRPAEPPSRSPQATPGTPTTGPPNDLTMPAPGGGRDGAPPSLVAVVLAAPIVLLAALLVARWARRQRHRRAGPAGAWSEVLDLLVLLDQRPPPWHTAVRIAHDVAAAYPGPTPHPALRLAEAADRATFSPGERRTEAPWSELRRLRQAVRRRVPWHRRLTWPFNPRPFQRRLGSGTGGTPPATILRRHPVA